MFAALGLFALGAGVSITHGIQELFHSEPASDFGVAYAVLGVSFILEGISFRQAYKQLRNEASAVNRDVMTQALNTSDPTTRAVFAEDAAALIGLVIAFVGVLLHQVTGSPVPPDASAPSSSAFSSGVIAIILIDRNRRFLVGEEASPTLRAAAIEALTQLPEINRITFLRMEYLGPRQVYLVASVDLVGDYAESRVAHTLRELERSLEQSPRVVRAILTLSTPEEPSITV